MRVRLQAMVNVHLYALTEAIIIYNLYYVNKLSFVISYFFYLLNEIEVILVFTNLNNAFLLYIGVT